jgi:hypothetical protein
MTGHAVGLPSRIPAFQRTAARNYQIGQIMTKSVISQSDEIMSQARSRPKAVPLKTAAGTYAAK